MPTPSVKGWLAVLVGTFTLGVIAANLTHDETKTVTKTEVVTVTVTQPAETIIKEVPGKPVVLASCARLADLNVRWYELLKRYETEVLSKTTSIPDELAMLPFESGDAGFRGKLNNLEDRMTAVERKRQDIIIQAGEVKNVIDAAKGECVKELK